MQTLRVRLFGMVLAALTATVACSDDGSGPVAPSDGSGDLGMDATASCSATQASCGTRCVDLRTDRDHCGDCGHACEGAQVCVGGACHVGCPAEQVVCDGQCVNAQTDLAHCGACGNACPAGQVCSLGVCTTSCDMRLAMCAGRDAGADAGGGAYCADLATDYRNCGACGTLCPVGQRCVDRACQTVCTPGQTVCMGLCRDTQTDRAHCGGCGQACGSGEVCVAGTCQTSCAMGQTECAGTCRDLATDRNHCGACGRACAAGQVCSNGACAAACGGGLSVCNGVCRDLKSDRAHCGTCGRACNTGEVCSDGVCQVSCGGGLRNCGGTCRDTATDRNHCGACGRACEAGEVCSAGVCQVSCSRHLTNCGGVCRDLTTDRAHCGACGTACPAGQVCSNGVCATSCAATLRNCDGTCRDLNTDRANCGACNTACATGQVCSQGTCALACQAGLTACEGVCRDLTTDRANCGACGTACPNGQVCSNGACAASCAASLSLCSGQCANLQTDEANCGMCGRACAPGTQCQNGQCATTCAPQLGTCGTGASAFCTNTEVDPANCGQCGRACMLPHTALNGCAAGECSAVRCEAGFGNCDGAPTNGCELDLREDASNCGGCGRVCAFANADARCLMGACTMNTCRRGFADCDRSPANGCETDTTTSATNCGACGTACPAGQVCSGGACVTACTAPYTTCGAGMSSVRCASTASDPVHCGTCGAACNLAHTRENGCAGGACVVVTCASGYADCDGTAGNGCETDLRTNVAHCGACGQMCTLPHATASCAAGGCAVRTCEGGFADCDGVPGDGCETDTRTDNANCGACGNACPAGQVCSNGTCTTTCAMPLTRCTDTSTADGRTGDFCANTAHDPANCGMCGTRCDLDHVDVHACTAGSCVIARCDAGYSDCDGDPTNGCEVHTRDDTNNCGACARACSAPNGFAGCDNGTCRFGGCRPGFGDCNGLAADGCETSTQSDTANCGMCGTRCAGGQVCAAGTCAASCGGALQTCGTGADAYCADTTSDPDHCGACGTRCRAANTADNLCIESRCYVLGCAAGYGNCDRDAANGCETSVLTDARHCGVCGRTCTLPNATAGCAAGSCTVAACNGGYANCNGLATDGCETNTQSDPANCGGCGQACPTGAACSNGRCVASCPSSQQYCGGACTDLQYDPDHCGTCATVCPMRPNATRWCSAGRCGYTCAAGRGDCDGMAANGCETDTTSDTAHCGTCGNRCTAPTGGSATCTAGLCASGGCPSGQTSCGGTCRATGASCTSSGSGGCEQTGTIVCASTGTGTVCNATPRTSGSCTSPVGGVCDATGACACPAGQSNCGGTCRTIGTSCMSSGTSSCVNSGMTVCSGTNAVCNATPRTSGTCTSPMGGVCDATGTCACAGSTPDNCNGTCTSTATDTSNCGRCGNACPSGQVCTGGTCTLTCGAGQTLCSGVCRNLTNDTNNCGACGTVCPMPANSVVTCSSGRCAGTCSAGFGECDGNFANGCETNTNTSAANCGRCGNACLTGQTCTNGMCVAACPTGQTACAGTCRNLMTDVANCGMCGQACAAGPQALSGTCTAGACRFVCATDFGDCDNVASNGCERSLLNDNANCGRCGAACGMGTVCSGGRCGTTCATGTTLCSGRCATLATDPANCGMCGRACTGTPPPNSVVACRASTCGFACAAGFGDCDGNTANGCERDVSADRSNCGACGVVCPTGTNCVAGGCTIRTYAPMSVPLTNFQNACTTPGHREFFPNTDDDAAGLDLGWNFPFYGRVFSSIWFSTNGVFGFGLPNTAFSNFCLPNTTITNAVFGFWDDLVTRTAMCVANIGTAPSRQLVITYPDVGFCCPVQASEHMTFSIVLNEGSGVVDVQFASMSHLGAVVSGTNRGGATIGVQGNSAAEFAQFSCNTDAITSNSQIRLTPQP